jgi:hypothetical protein
MGSAIKIKIKMTRIEFIKMCGILGISLSFPDMLMSCKKDNDDVIVNCFSGKVIIIGAGAGGLSSGYLLQQLGIDFEILEASSAVGMKSKRRIW